MGNDGEEKLLSDDEMAELEAMLPSPAFQQFKELFNGLLERVRAKDYEGIARFRDRLAEQIGKMEEASGRHDKTVRQFGRGREAGFSRVRMQSMFLDRVARMAKSKESPEEKIVGFPVGKRVKVEAPRRYEPAARPEVEPAVEPGAKPTAKPVVKPVVRKPEKAVPAAPSKKEAVGRIPAGRTPPSLPLVRGGILPAKGRVEGKGVPEGVSGGLEGVSAKGGAVKEKAKKVAAKAPLKKEAAKAAPKGKKKTEKDLKKYYEDRHKRVRKAIEKDQQKGTRIRFKEGEEFDTEEPDA